MSIYICSMHGVTNYGVCPLCGRITSLANVQAPLDEHEKIKLMDESKMTSTKKLGQIVEQLKAFVAAESYAKKNDPVKKQLANSLSALYAHSQLSSVHPMMIKAEKALASYEKEME